jgi:thiol-disulfide isomerase/thioredoxin
MKLITKISSFLLIILIIASCDTVQPPYEENSVITDSTEKVVLLEEYTGFRCGNCPAANEVAHQIKDKYPNNVILLAIHAGSLAMPTPNHKYDFRSKVMNDLEAYFNIAGSLGTPNGLVDRVPYNDNLILSSASWEPAVLERMKQKASVKITLEPSYDQSSRMITCKTKLTFLDKGYSSYHLALYVVEDSIVQYQTDYRKNPIDIYDYVHNSVIRDAMTSTWGEQVSVNDISKGTIISNSYQKIIPSKADWRPEWIRIVAILTDNNKSYEVIQSAEKYILK